MPHPGRSRVRRIAAVAALCTMVLGACSGRIAGTPVAAVTPPPSIPTSSSAPPPSSVAPSTTATPASPSSTSPSAPPTTTTAPPTSTSPTVAPAGSTSPMLVTGGAISRPEVPSGPAVSVALRSLPSSYDANSYSAAGYQTEIAALTQPSVYFIDPRGHLALDTDVVQKVTYVANPQKAVYLINPKATWSDGVPVSCQDFYLAWLASTSRAKPPASDDYPTAFDTFANTYYDGARAPQCADGGRTVTVTFTTPTPGWQTLFQGLLPAHVAAKDAGISDITTIKNTDTSGPVQKLAAAYRADFSTLNPSKNPSAGPYLLESASDSGVVLQRNPRWWGHTAGPDGVTLVLKPQDTMAIQAMRNGDADVASITDQNIPVVDTLHNSDEFVRTNQVWPVADHIEFSMHDALFTGKAGDALRQAMFSCVDRTAIVKTVVKQLNPAATPLGNLLVQPWDPAYTDHYAATRTANVAKAQQLMKQGGWTLGAGGIFAHGKTKAHFILGYLDNPTRLAVAKLVQRQCRQAGIDIAVSTVDINKLVTGKFQAALFGWSAPMVPAEYAETYSSKGASNTTGYSNKKVDTLFHDIAADLRPSNQTGRLNEIDQLLASSHVLMPLYDETAVNLQAPRIHTTVTNDYFWGGVVWDAYAWSVAG